MGKTVLIVDDDPTQRRLLQAVVEKSGFSTLQADNGDRALEMALGVDGLTRLRARLRALKNHRMGL